MNRANWSNYPVVMPRGGPPQRGAATAPDERTISQSCWPAVTLSDENAFSRFPVSGENVLFVHLKAGPTVTGVPASPSRQGIDVTHPHLLTLSAAHSELSGSNT